MIKVGLHSFQLKPFCDKGEGAGPIHRICRLSNNPKEETNEQRKKQLPQQHGVWNKNQKSTADAATVSSWRSAGKNKNNRFAAGGLEPIDSFNVQTRQWNAVIYIKIVSPY